MSPLAVKFTVTGIIFINYPKRCLITLVQKEKNIYINKAKRQRPTAVVQSSNGALWLHGHIDAFTPRKKKERNINYKNTKRSPKLFTERDGAV